jgi:hypothetical protein
MTTKPLINTNDLWQLAKNSNDKEAYKALNKTQVYRIGVGVRVRPPDTSFFIEVIVNLSDKSKKVDLVKLERILRFLRILQTKNYSLTYEDDNCIQCETTRASQDLNEEYLSIESILKTQLG